jgi:signal peptidase I
MSALTGIFYTILTIYLGGWYFEKWSGNFSLVLFILSVVTMFYWLAEQLYFLPKRKAAARNAEQQIALRNEELKRQGIAQIDTDVAATKHRLLAQPWWLDWTAGLFPVILTVFLLRSFLFEPFKIPSGSMIPTLMVGDLILVNKFHYGLRLPVINKKIISNHDPVRGDVMVFHYPKSPDIDYIKRVVGLPGDEVSYLNKVLRINGKVVESVPQMDYYDNDALKYELQFTEKLGDIEHRILLDKERVNFVPQPLDGNFPFRDHCIYSAEGVTCKVPEGHYFMMGDNRDNSQDSRYWGFVPDEYIVGRAFFVWMNFGNLKRIGAFH